MTNEFVSFLISLIVSKIFIRNMPEKNSCSICHKGGIVRLCDRCKQIFCDEHVIKHRRQSADQLNEINEEYHRIEHELRQSSNESHSLWKNIDQWENESIARIQMTAASMREEFRQMIDDSKERLANVCRKIFDNVHRLRQTGEFCENDLRRAREQLKQFRTKIDSPLTVQLIEHPKSVIHLIDIKGTDFLNEDLKRAKIYSVTKRVLTSDLQERFNRIVGPAIIEDNGLLARHTGPTSTSAYLIGEQEYSQGRQTIRFQIEHIQAPYKIFFGCVSSAIPPDQLHYQSSFVAGWFGHNEVYEHGQCHVNARMHGYESMKIETYDVLSLTLNCEERQIEFYPERTKKIHELPIDLDRAPMPWQVLVILTYANDRVKILYKI